MMPPCPLGLDDATRSAWRDGQLPAPQMARISAHLGDCPLCRARLAGFARTGQALARLPRLAGGDRIVHGVLAHIDRQERSPMTPRTRPPQRGIGAVTALALIAAFAVLFALVLRGHTGNGAITSSASPTVAATQPTTTLPGQTPIVSVAQAWGAGAATVITPQLDSQHYFDTGGISTDGHTIFGTSITYGGPGKGAYTSQPGTYSVATNRFTSFAFHAPPTALGPGVGCCTVTATHAIIGENDQPGATCGVCHTYYYTVDLATNVILPLRDPATQQPLTFINQFVSQDYDIGASATDGGYFLVDLRTGAPTTMLGLPLTISQQVIAFAWPYVAYVNSVEEGSFYNAPSVTLRDLRTRAEVVIHPPTAVHAAFGLMQPFSNNPGTPAPTATPIYAATGISGASITGDTLFFTSQTADATYLYEIDHMMTPGAPARAIATLPNHHDGTDYVPSGANDRVVVLHIYLSTAAGTTTGRYLAYDRVQRRFVDLLDYGEHMGDYQSVTMSGQALMFIAGSSLDVPNTDTIYDTAALRTTA